MCQKNGVLNLQDFNSKIVFSITKTVFCNLLYALSNSVFLRKSSLLSSCNFLISVTTCILFNGIGGLSPSCCSLMGSN